MFQSVVLEDLKPLKGEWYHDFEYKDMYKYYIWIQIIMKSTPKT